MKRTLQLFILAGAVFVGVSLMASPASAATHTVQSGDTLAKLFPTSWQAVCVHYGINCDRIYPGQVYSDDGLESASAAPQATLTSSTVGRSVPTYLAVGKPYVYGAAGPHAFDCSGLTQYLAARMGFSIPRTAAAQAAVGRSIPLSQALPGDLIVMRGGSHVGMVTGPGRMIQALNPSQGIVESTIAWGTSLMPINDVRAIGH